jgi:hypothetical protein
MKSICIVGKGSSLLTKNIASAIDEHDIIIRVNHLPDDDNYKFIGKKTTILSARSKFKLKNFYHKINDLDIWVCSHRIDRLSEFNLKSYTIINLNEIEYLRNYFNNFLNIKSTVDDSILNMIIPDTGITTILLAILRFPNYKINVCGFDLYKDGNSNIYTTKKNSSIFLTPVFQQIICYKSLIKQELITEL